MTEQTINSEVQQQPKCSFQISTTAKGFSQFEATVRGDDVDQTLADLKRVCEELYTYCGEKNKDIK